MNTKNSTLCLLILVAAFSRMIPHPPNFTAVCALSIFSGALFNNRLLAFLVPIFAMAISDFFIGYHSLLPLVYGCLLVNVALGLYLNKHSTFKNYFLMSVVSALFFFVVTNFGVWAAGAMYPKTGAGLLACYVAALPFLGNMLLGNIFYLALLKAIVKVAQRNMGAFGSATRDKRAHIFWATIIFFFSTQLIAVPQVFNRGNGSEPKDLDFHMTTGIPEFNIQQNIFEGLICKHPKTLKEIPGVAENWKISKDGKTYTFNLRKNAKWSNGDKVTAHDFVYAIQRLLEPKTAAEYAYQGFYLVNGKKFNAGEIKDFSKVGAKAKDDYTLVLTLEKPTPFFLSLMYHHSYYPLHKATVEKHGRNWTKAANIVTNGAFKVSKWEMNKVLSIVPNPHYWDKDKVKLTQVNFFPIENLDTEEKMFRTNELHMAYGVSTEKIPTWAKDKTGVFHIAPHLATYFYWINVQKPPLNNVKVRKALALGFDREKLVKYVTKGQQEPAQSFTPPGTAGYNPPKLLPKDLSRLKEAKQLLKEAGYPDGKGMPPVEILYNTENNHKKIAEALQQMWKENLGIPVTLSNQEWKVFVDNLRTHNFMLGRLGWVGDYNDPNTFLDLVVTDGGNNHAQYSNKEYDDLIARASTEMNSLKRFEYFKKAETIFLNELPLIPIYIYKRIYLLSPNVKGWYDNIEDIHPLKYVYLE